MHKIFLSLIFLSVYSLAGLINAVAVKINNDVITLFDIDQIVLEKNISKNNAVTYLIDKALFAQEIKKQNISVDIFDTNKYLGKLAAANGMDLYNFKSLIKQKYKNQSIFDDEIKERILKEKLTQSLLRGNLTVATQEDMKLYYDNNQNQYQSSVSYEVIQYASKNRRALLLTKKNPMALIKELKKKELTMENSKLSSQIKYILNETKAGEYTSIFTANKHYVMLYIKKKNGLKTQNFEEVKSLIFNQIMSEREKRFLDEHFKKARITANIEVIR